MKIKLATLLTLFLFILSGCGGSVEKPPLPDQSSEEITFQDSNNIDVDVYVDSTVSMGGFAAEDVTTSYVSMIPAVSNVSSTLSGTLGKVHYFSFGEKIVDIDQTRFNDARKQSFYTENGDINKKTDVNAVMKKVCEKFNAAGNSSDKPSKLSIIISDLFEDNSNVDPLITSMKKSFGDADLSIGFLGIRSYFNGKVFDIGRSTAGRPYTSDAKKTQSYRPFYMILLGKPGDVQKYYKELDKVYLNALPADTRYFEFFSRYNVLRQGTFENPVEIVPEGDKRAKIKVDTNFENPANDSRLQALKVYTGGVPEKDRTGEVLKADLTVKPAQYSRLMAALTTGKNIYKDKADSLLKIDTSVEAVKDGTFTAVEAGENCVENATVKLSDGKIATEICVNPYKLKAGYYRITVTASCDYDLFTPVIPADWNMKDENDPLFGTKTINLYNLLEGFYGLSKDYDGPLAQAYYYLKVVQ